METTGKLILFYFLFGRLLKIATFSDAWVAVSVSPLPSSHRGTGNTELWCGQIETACSIAGETVGLSRRSVLRLGSLVPMVGVSLSLLASPALATTAEVDPFAAMDDILSNGLPSAFASSGSPTASNTQTRTTAGEAETPIDDSKNAPSNTSPILQSDMAAALQESKRRKAIDPRTHG